MIKFDTIELEGKIYISYFETDEEEILIPIRDNLGRAIYGINSFSFIGQEFKKLIIPNGIVDIKENSFVDCYNLEEVFLDNFIYKEINLDKCFLKDSSNILFLVKNYPSVINYITEKFIIMENNMVFDFLGTQYVVEDNKVLITELPNLMDLYIPDFYEGKEVSLERLSAIYFEKNFLEIEKIRVPKNGFVRLTKLSSVKEICFSSLSRKIVLPIGNFRKVILFNNIESFVAPASGDYFDLKIFTIDDSINHLKKFIFPGIEDSLWYKNIKQNKDKTISYKGLLLKVSDWIKNNEYVIPNDIIFIRDGLFLDSNIKNIIFNNKIKNISSDCFYNCKFLKNVTFPKNIEYIGDRAFFLDLTGVKDSSREFIFEGDKKLIEIPDSAFDADYGFCKK